MLCEDGRVVDLDFVKTGATVFALSVLTCSPPIARGTVTAPFFFNAEMAS